MADEGRDDLHPASTSGGASMACTTYQYNGSEHDDYTEF